MTASEFINMAVGTKVFVRDVRTGKYIKEQKDYADRKVVECYSRTHRSNGKYNSNIVIMVR